MSSQQTVLLVVLLFLVPGVVVGVDSDDNVGDGQLECEEPLHKHYCVTKGLIAKELPPQEPPLIVFLDLGVSEVASVDDLKLTVTARMFITMTWTDERIVYTATDKDDEDVYLDIDLKDKIFIPEIYIYELLKYESPEVLKKSESLTMSSASNVSFYFEGQITTVCNMDYTKYPLDSQKCNIKFGSISQQNDVIVFEGQLTFNQNTQRTLQYSVDITMLEERDKIYVDNWGWNYSVTGIDIWLQRYTTPFLLQFYLPSAMFVLISWIGFVIPHDSGERTGMIVTLLLVVVSMYLAVVAASPKAQTLTAIEMWLVACIGFLFLSLIELGLVIQAATLLDKDEKKKKKKKAKYSLMQTIFNRGREEELEVPPRKSFPELDPPDDGRLPAKANEGPRLTRGERIAKRIDHLSLVIFPVGFIVFMVFYSLKYSA